MANLNIDDELMKKIREHVSKPIYLKGAIKKFVETAIQEKLMKKIT